MKRWPPLNFLITHKSPSNVPTSNILTFPGNPATLGKDIGLAFKKSGSSADSIANKVTNSLAKAFEDWIDSCRGTYVEVAPNGTVLTTNWTGLKYDYLRQLILIETDNLNLEDELPFSKENAEILMKNSGAFDTWVTETVGDLENFTMIK